MGLIFRSHLPLNKARLTQIDQSNAERDAKSNRNIVTLEVLTF